MKPDIHPELKDTKFVCVCGSDYKTVSTLGGTIKVEICAACHPAYTGQGKMVDIEGRIERFRQKYDKSNFNFKKTS